MCGRFGQFAPSETIAAQFDTDALPDLSPRYNVAPTQPVVAIRAGENDRSRRLSVLHWGLIPPWSKDASGSARLINARAETVFDKPAFRRAARRRRTIIPANGFYEWERTQGPRNKKPFYIELASGRLLALAGLWETWEGPEGWIESCTILTCPANELIAGLHDRMPVILPPEAFEIWLDPGAGDPDILRPWLNPYPSGEMSLRPVGNYVNKVSNEGPRCLEGPAQGEILWPENKSG